MEAADQYFHSSGFWATSSPQLTPEKRRHFSPLENKEQHFAVEDLLDFSKDEDVVGMDGDDVASGLDSATGGSSTDSSTITAVDSCHSASFSGCNPGVAAAAGASGGGDVTCRMGFGDGDNFSGELCVPYDDLAELEWLSNFVEESFSSEDLQKLQLLSGIKAQRDQGPESTPELRPDPAGAGHHSSAPINSPIFQSDVSVPAKARSKRSRAAPGNWDSRLIALTEPDNSSSHTEPDGPAPVPRTATGKKNPRAGPKKKPAGPEQAPAGEARKCLHCATDKTPQWRTGPMGPKTLCNACGVRYKSGRLVPEYRPAASPTFMLTKHSNSHRKVLELRRQKELLRAQQHQQFGLRAENVVFDMSGSDDHLIHQHVGPDFRQLI